MCAQAKEHMNHNADTMMLKKLLLELLDLCPSMARCLQQDSKVPAARLLANPLIYRLGTGINGVERQLNIEEPCVPVKSFEDGLLRAQLYAWLLVKKIDQEHPLDQEMRAQLQSCFECMSAALIQMGWWTLLFKRKMQLKLIFLLKSLKLQLEKAQPGLTIAICGLQAPEAYQSLQAKAIDAATKNRWDKAIVFVYKSASYRPFSHSGELLHKICRHYISCGRAVRKLNNEHIWRPKAYTEYLLNRADLALNSLCEGLHLANSHPLIDPLLTQALGNGCRMLWQQLMERFWHQGLQLQDDVGKLRLMIKAGVMQQGLQFAGAAPYEPYFEKIQQLARALTGSSPERMSQKLAALVLGLFQQTLKPSMEVSFQQIEGLLNLLEQLQQMSFFKPLHEQLASVWQDLHLLFHKDERVVKLHLQPLPGKLMQLHLTLDTRSTVVVCLQALEGLIDLWTGVALKYMELSHC